VSATAAYLRSLNPRLPRSVLTLQAGGLANAFGNGLAVPFLFIYLHNVRGIDLATAGLIVGTNGAVGLVAGPLAGSLIDRVGGKRTLIVSLLFMTVGYGSYPFVEVPWQGFLVAAIAGIGNGGFWPAQSSLIAGLTPPDRRHSAFAVQRVTMNLGIGLGGLAGGLIATTDRPGSFTLLFLLDALTFVLFIGALSFVPQPERHPHAHGDAGSYREVLRNRVFVAVLALNFVFIASAMAQFEVFPVYGKNEAGISERTIGVIWFVNTVVIVLAQLPIARALEGRRRMPVLALLGVVWATALALIPIAATAFDGSAALALFLVAFAIFAVGECLHGTVQAPLVADLADPRLIGRYMALSAFSWGLGFTLGPMVGGFVLELAPHAWWRATAAICLAAGAAALVLERALPRGVRRTPRSAHPVAREPVVAEVAEPVEA
jgi:MFS family permease